MAIVTRTGKGSALSWEEMDNNLTELNSGITDNTNEINSINGSLSDTLKESSNLAKNGGTIPETDRVNTFAQQQRIHRDGGGATGFVVRSADDTSANIIESEDSNGNQVWRIITNGMNGNGAGYADFQDADKWRFRNGFIEVGSPSGSVSNGDINAEGIYINGEMVVPNHVYNNRSTAQTATVDSNVKAISYISDNGQYTVNFVRAPANTSNIALTTADGEDWIPANAITPLHFGAQGNDVNDDSDAIQAAVNYIVNNNLTNHLRIPAGTYKTTYAINLKGVSVVGDGLDHTILKPTLTAGQTTKAAFYSNVDWDFAEVRGLYFDLQNVDGTNSALDAEAGAIRSYFNIRVTGGTIVTGKHGLVIRGVNPSTSLANNRNYNNYIENCDITGCDIGIYFYGQNILNARINANIIISGRLSQNNNNLYINGQGNIIQGVTLNPPTTGRSFILEGNACYNNIAIGCYFDNSDEPDMIYANTSNNRTPLTIIESVGVDKDNIMNVGTGNDPVFYLLNGDISMSDIEAITYTLNSIDAPTSSKYSMIGKDSNNFVHIKGSDGVSGSLMLSGSDFNTSYAAISEEGGVSVSIHDAGNAEFRVVKTDNEVNFSRLLVINSDGVQTYYNGSGAQVATFSNGNLSTSGNITSNAAITSNTLTINHLLVEGEDEISGGFGKTNLPIAPDDLNDINETGFFGVYSNSNNSPDSFMTLLSMRRVDVEGSSPRASQLAISAGAAQNDAYFRSISSGSNTSSWQAWRKILHDANLAENGGTIPETDRQNIFTTQQRVERTGGSSSGFLVRSTDDNSTNIIESTDSNGNRVWRILSNNMNGNGAGDASFQDADSWNFTSNVSVSGGDTTVDSLVVRTNSVNSKTDIELRSNAIIASESSLRFGTESNTSSFIWYTELDGVSNGNLGGIRQMLLDSDGLIIGNPTGGLQGSGTINAEELYINGEQLLSEYTFVDRDTANSATIPTHVQHIGYLSPTGYLVDFVRDDNGTALQTADGQTWSPAKEATHFHFGAIGDGAADDTAAMIALRDYVQSFGNDPAPEIYLPYSNIRITSKLSFSQAFLRIRGDGLGRPASNTALRNGGTLIYYDGSDLTSTEGVIEYATSFTGTGVILEDLSIVCQHKGNGVYMDRAAMSEISRVYIGQPVVGIVHAESSYSSAIDRCEIFDPEVGGIDLRQNSHAASVTRCRFNNLLPGGTVTSQTPDFGLRVGIVGQSSQVTVLSNNFDYYRVTRHIDYAGDCRGAAIISNYIECRGDGVTGAAIVIQGGAGIIHGNRISKSNNPTTTNIDYAVNCFVAAKDWDIRGNCFQRFDVAAVRIANGATNINVGANQIDNIPAAVNDQNVSRSSTVDQSGDIVTKSIDAESIDSEAISINGTALPEKTKSNVFTDEQIITTPGRARAGIAVRSTDTAGIKVLSSEDSGDNEVWRIVTTGMDGNTAGGATFQYGDYWSFINGYVQIGAPSGSVSNGELNAEGLYVNGSAVLTTSTLAANLAVGITEINHVRILTNSATVETDLEFKANALAASETTLNFGTENETGSSFVWYTGLDGVSNGTSGGTSRMELGASGLKVGSPTGGLQGAGTINSENGFYENGVKITSGGGSVSSFVYSDRSAAEAATVSSNVNSISYISSNGYLVVFVRDNSGTALQTADGQNWSPAQEVTGQHWGADDSGSTNCHIEMNAAWNWATDNDKELYAPAGLYVFGDSLVTENNYAKIRGDGSRPFGNASGSLTIFKSNGVGAGGIISLNSATGPGTLLGGTIEGITIDGNQETDTIGIRSYDGVVRQRLKDLCIIDCDECLRTGDSHYSWDIVDCWFQDFQTYGCDIRYNFNACNFYNCRWLNSGNTVYPYDTSLPQSSVRIGTNRSGQDLNFYGCEFEARYVDYQVEIMQGKVIGFYGGYIERLGSQIGGPTAFFRVGSAQGPVEGLLLSNLQLQGNGETDHLMVIDGNNEAVAITIDHGCLIRNFTDSVIDNAGGARKCKFGANLTDIGITNIFGGTYKGMGFDHADFVQITIPHDGVFALTPPAQWSSGALSGQIEFYSRSAGEAGKALYSAESGGASITGLYNTTNVSYSTGSRNGTTSFDGDLLISPHTDGKIYIQNRTGSSIDFVYSFCEPWGFGT